MSLEFTSKYHFYYNNLFSYLLWYPLPPIFAARGRYDTIIRVILGIFKIKKVCGTSCENWWSILKVAVQAPQPAGLTSQYPLHRHNINKPYSDLDRQLAYICLDTWQILGFIESHYHSTSSNFVFKSVDLNLIKRINLKGQ
jgi:hypothetical protein